MTASLKQKLGNTHALRMRLLETWEGVEQKQISISEGRAKALIAREILNTIRVEMVAAKVGLTAFAPVSFDPPTVIDAVEGQDHTAALPQQQS